MIPRISGATYRNAGRICSSMLKSRASAVSTRPSIHFLRPFSSERLPPELDLGMNGGYVNPPAIKRQFRSPYDDWWDKQDRKNFGEPRHEDEDIMGVFSPEEYTHAKPKTAFLHMGVFIGTVFGLCGIVYIVYPDKPAVPRTFADNGLETALGGKRGLAAASEEE